MKRRTFALLTLSGIAAISLPIGCIADQVVVDDKLIHPDVLMKISDSETLISIGKGYLQEHSEESKKRSLVENLPSGENLSSAIDDQVTLDYKNHNTVMIDGWILSVTEARQCALYSLTQLN